MSRTQKSEEWERKKLYLISSLFEDVPILSPIQEERESELSSLDCDFRANSPLPDLIIEKEPKKRNLCDEPEEFYDNLAKEMKLLYKRDHYAISDSTNILDSFESVEENEYVEPIKIIANSNTVSENQELENISHIGDHMEHTTCEFKEKEACEKIKNTIIEEPYLSSTGSSDSDINFYSQQIDTQAEVYSYNDKALHKDVMHIEKCGKNACVKDAIALTNDIENITPALINSKSTEECAETLSYIENGHKESDEALKSHTTSEILVNTEKSKDEEEEEKEEHSKDFAINSDASGSSATEDSEPLREFAPDIMRRGHNYTSFDSVADEISKSNSDGLLNETIYSHSMEIEEAVVSYGPKEAADSPNYLNSFLRTSTPKSDRKSKIVTRRYRKRLASHSSSSISCKSACVQASFSDDDPDWPMFWNQVFVGTPTFYNICSCKNHVCFSLV